MQVGLSRGYFVGLRRCRSKKGTRMPGRRAGDQGRTESEEDQPEEVRGVPPEARDDGGEEGTDGKPEEQADP